MTSKILDQTVIMSRKIFVAAEGNLQAAVETLERKGYIVLIVEPNNPRSISQYWKITASERNVHAV